MCAYGFYILFSVKMLSTFSPLFSNSFPLNYNDLVLVNNSPKYCYDLKILLSSLIGVLSTSPQFLKLKLIWLASPIYWHKAHWRYFDYKTLSHSPFVLIAAYIILLASFWLFDQFVYNIWADIILFQLLFIGFCQPIKAYLHP